MVSLEYLYLLLPFHFIVRRTKDEWSESFEGRKSASVYRYTYMTSKNLTVREEAYNKLLEAKMNNESFSDVIARLLEGKKDLMSFAGIFSNDKEFEEATKDILEVRKKTTLRKRSRYLSIPR